MFEGAIELLPEVDERELLPGKIEILGHLAAYNL